MPVTTAASVAVSAHAKANLPATPPVFLAFAMNAACSSSRLFCKCSTSAASEWATQSLHLPFLPLDILVF
jgi:hypothetical protein